ncbi:MAG: enoyl-CoA hydratase/isomerase family protein [Bacteroidales bacterium]|nr:enoyl-CoA hydratase/isomerase family protein [Bacteroidales bacterium]
MEYNILKTEINEGIALVTISRPKAMNALNTAFFDEMNSLLNELQSNQEIKVMVLTGDGKAFVAGADIAEMVGKNQAEGEAFSKYGQKTFDRVEAMPFPVIAAVNGFALGGGCELAMSCDFRIASSKAKFGQPEVNLGLIPGYAGTQRMARLIGKADAMYLLMTADMIGAEDALRLKLVQKVFEPEMLMEEVMKIARNIAFKGPQAVRKVKEVTRMGLNASFAEGADMEAKHFGTLFGDGSEGKEGMTAFLEKRKPNW